MVGIGTLAADIPAGFIVNRIGRKAGMVIGCVLYALSVLCLFWVQSIWLVILLRLITGASTALWSISRHAFLAGTTVPDKRGRSISVIGGAMRISLFLGPALGGAVASRFGLRAPFLIFAGLSLLAGLVVIFFVKDPGDDRQSRVGGEGLRVVAFLKKHYRILFRAGSGQLFAAMIRTGRRIVIPLYAAEVIGLNVQMVGLIQSISNLVDMTMFYPAGLLMDRFGRKFAIVPCFLIQGIAMMFMPLTHGFAGLLIVACVIGLGNGLGSGSMLTLSSDLAPKESIGVFLGMWRVIADSGISGSPMIIGAIAGAFSLSASVVIISSFGVIAAGIFAFFVPETRRKSP